MLETARDELDAFVDERLGSVRQSFSQANPLDGLVWNASHADMGQLSGTLSTRDEVKGYGQRTRKGTGVDLQMQNQRDTTALEEKNWTIATAPITSSTLVALIEGCSGSGKSLTAAEYFVRNPDCVYFLLGLDHQQPIYKCVERVTTALNQALEHDLSCLRSRAVASGRFTEVKEMARRLRTHSMDVRSEKSYFLGTLGFLLGRISHTTPVSVETALGWRKPGREITVLMDEAIPFFARGVTSARGGSQVEQLVLAKRYLAAANIHLIMLGTNTLVLNFETAAMASTDSRDYEHIWMRCVSHRALPPYLPAGAHERILAAAFGEDLMSTISSEAVPLLAVRLADALMDRTGEVNALQLASFAAMRVIWQEKRRKLSDASIYCIWQIATNTGLSQAHLSQGFASLRMWGNSEAPKRGSRNCVVNLGRLERSDTIVTARGENVKHIKSSYSSALKDPILAAVCAGGGLPFSECRAAIRVLQDIHSEKSLDDPTAVDAVKRDGNLLESFVAVVVMICSWAEPKSFLSSLAFHFNGVEVDSTTVLEILAGGVLEQSTLEWASKTLEDSFRTLVPLSVQQFDEVQRSGRMRLGCYVRSKDDSRKDASIVASLTQNCGATVETKNWKNGISQARLTRFLDLAIRRMHAVKALKDKPPVVLLAVSSLAPQAKIEESLQKCVSDSNWIVLHLAPQQTRWKCSHFMLPSVVRNRILIVLECGLETLPFRTAQEGQQDCADSDPGELLSVSNPKLLEPDSLGLQCQ